MAIAMAAAISAEAQGGTTSEAEAEGGTAAVPVATTTAARHKFLPSALWLFPAILAA